MRNGRLVQTTQCDPSRQQTEEKNDTILSVDAKKSIWQKFNIHQDKNQLQTSNRRRCPELDKGHLQNPGHSTRHAFASL